MLRWPLSLALVFAATHATFADPSLQFNEPGDALQQCQGRAWVRAPDMVPGDVIAGDVKVKLIGPCANAESYTLGLRYRERIFWKLRRQDAPLPKRLDIKYNFTNSDNGLFQDHLPFQNTGVKDYNETEWMAYQMSAQNKDSWSVHEEERIVFEIKTNLVSADMAASLPTDFTTRFGIMVPNTNYPPGLDYRLSSRTVFIGETDTIWSDSIYEYFVEIKFSNGTTSELPAGMTAFTPFYLSTKKNVPHVNLSLERTGSGSNLEQDVLQSNYTVEISFPDEGHIYQNSSVNIVATVHRAGYTNRTDTPMELCAFMDGLDSVEWHPQALKNRSQSQPSAYSIKALIPSDKTVHSPGPQPPCREINSAVTADLTQEGHVSSTSSEPLSFSLFVPHDAVPDFSTYYQRLLHRISLTLHIKPDPSDPWEHEWEKEHWEKQVADMDETDFDWVP